jgi:hypothetical protein
LTTDATVIDSEVCAFVVDAIEYLERNDFTGIVQIGFRLIRTMDGTKGVYVWLDSTSANHAIPVKLVEMARAEHCRIDIISIDRVGLKHQMNAVEADDATG